MTTSGKPRQRAYLAYMGVGLSFMRPGDPVQMEIGDPKKILFHATCIIVEVVSSEMASVRIVQIDIAGPDTREYKEGDVVEAFAHQLYR